MALTDIIKPIITEKSFTLSQKGQFSFLVNPTSNKHSVAQAIEALFKVKVLKVRILKNAAKIRRSGKKRLTTTVSAQKKAVITLAKGQTIEYFQIPEEKTATTKKNKTVAAQPKKDKPKKINFLSRRKEVRTQDK